MEYNRDKDGKFAPKGTGDKTGFEKGFSKAMPKRGNAATEGDINEALDDNAWKITDGETVGEYAKEVAELLGIPAERVMETMRRGNPNLSEDDDAAEAAGLNEPPEPIEPEPDDPELERLLSENLKYVTADQTPENIEKGNAAGEALAAYVLEGASQEDIDEYDTISGTYKDPDELAEIARKIVAKRRKAAPDKGDLPW